MASAESGSNGIARVSLSSSGEQANDGSGYPAVSSDGRYVAFSSTASNIVADDTNGKSDVFLADRTAGTTTLVSGPPGGGSANDESWDPSVSPDGRYIAFASWASNLITGDTNGTADVFVLDRTSGATSLVSLSSGGVQPDGWSAYPSISADGHTVAFVSEGSNLVAGDTNGKQDVFVRDLNSGTTTLVSVSSSGAAASDWSDFPAISADGRYVTFDSPASNLVAGDTNGKRDIFVRDLTSGATTRVSESSNGGEASGDSEMPSISENGRYVAFDSDASNIVAGDTNGQYDVFVKDRSSGAVSRASLSSAGGQANDDSGGSSISADGHAVAFSSWATNLVAGNPSGRMSVFVRDRASGGTSLTTVAPTGAEANDASGLPSISSDGQSVAFGSGASNLVTGDTNGVRDVFLARLDAPTYALTVSRSGTGSGTVSSRPAGITCGTTCTLAYAHGTGVVLRASPSASSIFTGWAGACTGTGECRILMTADRQAGASFRLKTFKLTVARSGSGKVSSSPSGVNCGSTCSASFPYGTRVTLRPSASSGYAFAGWSGACSGTGTCRVAMTAARSVKARFKRR